MSNLIVVIIIIVVISIYIHIHVIVVPNEVWLGKGGDRKFHLSIYITCKQLLYM